MWPQARSSRPSSNQIGGDGLLLQHQEQAAFDGWSAHVRYFLARYPFETRQFVAQRLATYGIWRLLASHHQEDLTLDILASATDSADKDVMSIMREHARGRRKKSSHAPPPPPEVRQAPASVDAGPAPRAALQERGRAENVPDRAGMPSYRRKRHAVVGRPDVLTRYPFVDDLAGERGGGVGAALKQATPTTPVQHLAKREIRRLAHETFSELKASALGIRLSDLPTALQYLFFSDSASLLPTKGTGPQVAGDSGGKPPARSAKDVHLVMALARESLSPTLALAARDTSTLSSASTHEGPETGWARDGQNMFISERRWMKLVAHVVRRLWEIDGTPRSGDASIRPPRIAVADPLSATAVTKFQPPLWQPTGGGVVTGRSPARLPGRDGDEENVQEAFSRSAVPFRPDSTWGSAAASGVRTDDHGAVPASRASRVWNKMQGESECWAGAGRSLTWAPDISVGAQLFDESGTKEVDVREVCGRGGDHDSGRRDSVAVRDIRSYRGGGRRGRDGVRQKAVGLGGIGDKEGTRPAGMWQVTPQAHVVAMSRAKQTRDGSRKKEGPAYLRGVRSKIGAQVGAHRERLRKIANARKSAVRDTVARRRLESLDGAAGHGVADDVESGADRDGRLPNRGHTPGEHALDIANAFLESSLMTRLAGGDWGETYGGEDGKAVSAPSSSVWGEDNLARLPRSRQEDRRDQGSDGARMRYFKRSGTGTESNYAQGDVAARPRPSHSGWLGDFGLPHTHTVRETLLDEEGEEEEEYGGGSKKIEAEKRTTMRSNGGAEGYAAMREVHEDEKREGSLEGSGTALVGRSIGNGSGGGGVDDADVDPVRSTIAVESASLGSNGSGSAHTRGEAVDIVSPRDAGVAFHLRNQTSSGVGSYEGGAATPGGESEEKIADPWKGDGTGSHLYGGLDAYLRLSSDSGAVSGGGEARQRLEGAGVGSSGGDRGGRVISTEETSGETDGWCWWEEDR